MKAEWVQAIVQQWIARMTDPTALRQWHALIEIRLTELGEPFDVRLVPEVGSGQRVTMVGVDFVITDIQYSIEPDSRWDASIRLRSVHGEPRL